MQTKEEIIRIANEWATTSAPKGLVVDETPSGQLNGTVLATYLKNHGLPFSVENLSIAAEAEKSRLNWLPGFEPKASPAPVVPRSRANDPFNAMIDGGAGAPFRAYTHADRMADQARAREDAGRQREAAIAKQNEVEQSRAQHAAETQLIFRETGPFAGQVDWPATFGAREAAKKKRTQSDIRSAVPAEIPAGTTDFRPYSAEQIRRYIQRDTNRYAVKNR